MVADGTHLVADDVERTAMAAYLTGRTDAAVAGLQRAHHAFIEEGRTARAIRCAFWLAMMLIQRGEHAPAAGWLTRAGHLLDESSLDCAERGYLLLPGALRALDSDAAEAYRLFGQAAEIAERFADADLLAMGRLGTGQALIVQGDAVNGVALLDEAMVAVIAGEVSAIPAGIVYCAVIIACRDTFDLRRAQEWTAALSRWCATHQDLRPYRGQCLVHRSEIMQLRGEWADAIAEVRAACEHLSDPPGDPVLGMALYQRAELHRLRGELADAEAAYRGAGDCGHAVHPGLALLRLTQGRVDDARAAISRVAGDAEDDKVRRSQVLSAFVEIMLAAGDTDAARDAVDELAGIAAEFASPYLEATSGRARGAVLLAEGEAGAACAALRRAWTVWHQLDAPYEAARTRTLMALACRELGDHDTAEMELDAARRVFEDLGAAPALAVVAAASARPSAPGGLTAREMEVLRQVAGGATNREIADGLVISEHTVRRHLQNIFTKLDVPSRAAATAFAYEHGLI